MIGILARLSRSLPLVIALIVLAATAYIIISWLRSKERAKEILIRAFTIICGAITIFFALVSLYAVADSSQPVLELSASFAAVGLLGLIITRICARVFKRRHPNYAKRAQKTTMEPPPTSAPDLRRTLFWKLYDLLGKFRPKQ